MLNEQSPAKQKSHARLALEKTSSWYTFWIAGVEITMRARSWWQERHAYMITVDSDDPMYQDVNDWLLENVPVENQRKLAAHSNSVSDDYDDSQSSNDKSTPEPARLYLTYDANHEQTISVNGYKVKVNLERVQDPEVRKYGSVPDRITFTAASLDGQRAVRDHLDLIVAERKAAKRRPILYMLNHWGSWQRRSDLPLRPAGSVVLREGQMERLIADLGEFLTRESDYVKRGIPWHRGFLLQGPPGTGKTSIAKALANEFGLDLWYAPLGDINKDANLLSLLSEVHPRSMLLLEDVDIYHAATHRQAETNALTLSGLLNALDGVATPHGLITILTSNEPEMLDKALVRPGRIDRVEDVGYVTEDQAKRLFCYFYGYTPPRRFLVAEKVSVADLAELFKQNLDDARASEAALADPPDGMYQPARL